jgi:DNA-binding transcriptional LysR family regulator
MHDWDDLRFFLAVAKSGSITAASVILKVNQSTVSRRINHFEQLLNVRLFERLATGYVLTAEGEELKQRALRIEEETQAIERHIMGKNIKLTGPIRVTASSTVTRYLLMPLFKHFYSMYPGIELRLDLSDQLYNINAREADVAIRVTGDAVPENLIGRKLGQIEFGVYGEKKYAKSYENASGAIPLRWIGEDINDLRPKWLPDNIANLQRVMRTNDVLATVEAIRMGIGVGRLPTFVGDADKKLVRLDFKQRIPQAPIWLLTHVDMRRVNRISVFNTFIAAEMSRILNSTD